MEPQEVEVKPGFVGSISCFAEHPLLLDHGGPQAQVFFSSAPSSPAEVFHVAHAVLEQTFAGWRAPARYLNGSPEAFAAYLKGGYGLLARGPLGAMNALVHALRSMLAVNLVPSHELSGALCALTLDKQFVVCRAVEVVPVDS